MMISVRLLAPLLAAFATAPLHADSGLVRWRYSEASATDVASAPEVTVPHTWNATDATGRTVNGTRKGDYRRGDSYYATTLPALSGKRVFVRFEGVSTCADVSLNGETIGAHRGLGTAFVFELTKALRRDGTDTLLVKASNAKRDDVAPLSGDFTVPGGIYRPVHILEKPVVCLGSVRGDFGAKVVQLKADKNSGEIAVTAHVDNGGAPAPVVVEFELRDATGKVVAQETSRHAAPAGVSEVSGKLSVDAPHLWNGLADPYLYRLVVSVKSGDTTDATELDVGFRKIRIDPKEGFFLNGVLYPLRGVNRHQDRDGKSWAVTTQDELNDVALIREIGANTVRCAHYPHSRTFLDACDREGLLVWAEEPLVDTVGSKPEALADNLEIQLREMIAQQRHHPAVFTWSLFNELHAAEKPDSAPVAVAKRMQAVAREEDPTRPTAGATDGWSKPLNSIPDIMAYNRYPGWYGGGAGSQSVTIAGYRRSIPEKPWGISEYGAGGSIEHQDDEAKRPPTRGKWHPESWQTRVHEHALESILADRTIWGTFVWNMFDFAAAHRNEGSRPGINDKGLVTYDRKTRKDAFWLYKANWSKEPVLRLLASRDTARKNADTVIRYYANVDDVKVTLNGADAGKAERYGPAAYIVKNVRLNKGRNVIETSATAKDGTTLADRVERTLE